MPKSMICTGESGSAGEVIVGWSKRAEQAQIGVRRVDGDTSLFTDFSSRSQINGLIRLLKQARDDAFGRDE